MIAEFPNIQLLLADLKECSRTRDLQRGKQIHAQAIDCGHDSHIYVANALINMYGKCGSMLAAHQVFDSIQRSNVASWTALLLGYADNGEGPTALNLLSRMRIDGVAPDFVTLVAALKACTCLTLKEGSRKWIECICRGKKLHNLAMENGWDSNIFVQSSLIDLYAKCNSMDNAYQVFRSMKQPDVVSWNVLILGYADNGHGFTALDLFRRMRTGGLSPNSVTFVAALKACTSLGWTECRDWSKKIHNLAIENTCNSDVYVQNTLIDMYSNCKSMLEAHEVFSSIKHPTVVSWTALILGYADNGQALTALDMFTRMQNVGPAPNSVTIAAALKVCALLGALDFGRTLHSKMKCVNLLLVNCLVDFYAKCGSLKEAQSVFDFHVETRDLVTWNALLGGFSNCGDNSSVFSLFKQMQDANILPNGVTFLSILKYCSHAGLVDKGKNCFDKITNKYGIIPTVEHYTCMVDIFGRANKLDDALALLEIMPCSPDYVTWTSILASCCKWKNVDIGRLAFQSLINLNPRDEAAYVLMGLLFGSRGMLQEQEMVMGMKRTQTSRSHIC